MSRVLYRPGASVEPIGSSAAYLRLWSLHALPLHGMTEHEVAAAAASHVDSGEFVDTADSCRLRQLYEDAGIEGFEGGIYAVELSGDKQLNRAPAAQIAVLGAEPPSHSIFLKRLSQPAIQNLEVAPTFVRHWRPLCRDQVPSAARTAFKAKNTRDLSW